MKYHDITITSHGRVGVSVTLEVQLCKGTSKICPNCSEMRLMEIQKRVSYKAGLQTLKLTGGCRQIRLADSCNFGIPVVQKGLKVKHNQAKQTNTTFPNTSKDKLMETPPAGFVSRRNQFNKVSLPLKSCLWPLFLCVSLSNSLQGENEKLTWVKVLVPQGSKAWRQIWDQWNNGNMNGTCLPTARHAPMSSRKALKQATAGQQITLEGRSCL